MDVSHRDSVRYRTGYGCRRWHRLPTAPPECRNDHVQLSLTPNWRDFCSKAHCQYRKGATNMGKIIGIGLLIIFVVVTIGFGIANTTGPLRDVKGNGTQQTK